MGAVLRAACATLLCVFAFGASAWADARRVIQVGDAQFEELEPQALEPGRCGLFVWASAGASEQPAFILVAYDQPSEAHVRINGDRRRLARVSFAGEAQYGQFQTQAFSDGQVTISVSAQFDPNKPVQDGAVIKSGVLKLIGDDGWETVLPIAGMAACQR